MMSSSKPSKFAAAFAGLILSISVITGLLAISDITVYREAMLEMSAGVTMSHGVRLGNPVYGETLAVIKGVLAVLGVLAVTSFLNRRKWANQSLEAVAAASILYWTADLFFTVSRMINLGRTESYAVLLREVFFSWHFFVFVYLGLILFYFSMAKSKGEFAHSVGHEKSLLSLQMIGLILLAGFLLPSILQMCVRIYFKPHEAMRAITEFPATLFGNNGIYIALLNVVPFVVLSYVLHISFIRSQRSESDNALLRRCGASAAAVGVIANSLIVNLSVFSSPYTLQGSSAAVVSFAFLPAYGLLAIPIGYALGWLIGLMGLKIK